MKRIRTHNKKGFTFIETLVAITILLIAVVAPMSLAQDGIVAARLAQDQIVAFYLGQEGVEIVKNLRDNNRLNNAALGQLSGAALSECIVVDPDDITESGCIVDARPNAYDTERCVGQCEPVSIDEGVDRTLYTHSGTGITETKYIREVKVWYPDISDTDEAVVEATVTWPFGKGGIIKSYKVRNYLYDW